MYEYRRLGLRPISPTRTFVKGCGWSAGHHDPLNCRADTLRQFFAELEGMNWELVGGRAEAPFTYLLNAVVCREIDPARERVVPGDIATFGETGGDPGDGQYDVAHIGIVESVLDGNMIVSGRDGYNGFWRGPLEAWQQKYASGRFYRVDESRLDNWNRRHRY